MGKDKKRNTTRVESKVGWEFVERLLSSQRLRVIYMWGPPGVGKTYAAYTKGRIQCGVVAITLTEETPAAELRGFWAPQKDELVWRDGPATDAMRKGARLVINELQHASADVLALLFPVLESVETARLTLPTGETVFPEPGFNVILTDNSPPDQLPHALVDRFDAILPIMEPHPEALARLSPAIREAALHTFDLEPDRAISIRSWLRIENLKEELGLEDACRAVFGPDRGAHVFDAVSLAQS
jgi:MoxR-like ATPase